MTSPKVAGPRAVTLLVATLAVGLGSCIPALPILPAPRSVQRSSTTHAPIERLGRFHEGRFIPVTAGSLPVSHLHVIVHGWAPGWLPQVMRDPELRSWEAVDDHGAAFEPWIADLAQVILDEDPHAVVVAYSWIDQASTGRTMYAQRTAWSYTELHGLTLAQALHAGLDDDFYARGGRVHLVGHSYGARVATIGALAMTPKPRQLTLFESPDASITVVTGAQNRLGELLEKLPIGNGEGEVFVDNYFAMLGTGYRSPETPGVVDVVLNPAYGTLSYRNRHLYPMEFYRRSAGQDFGMGWSPFFAGRPPAPGCYEQVYGEIEVSEGCRWQPIRP